MAIDPHQRPWERCFPLRVAASEEALIKIAAEPNACEKAEEPLPIGRGSRSMRKMEISRFEAAIRGSGTGPSLDQPSPIDPFQ